MPSSSVSVSESAVTANLVAFVSAAKYACSCAIASGGPAIIVAAGCAIVIASPARVS